MLIKRYWIISSYVLLLIGCTSKDISKDIPKEGEIVTWKQNPNLIVKAKLGPRRKHIPAQFDNEFYRPEREHYLGQFPIDYIPEKFPAITQEEANTLPMPDSNRQLEFYLTFNREKIEATDGFAPDHKDQVRVRIKGLGLEMRENNTDTKKVILNNITPEYVKMDSKFKKFGLECYRRIFSDEYLFCYADSNIPNVSGVFLKVNTRGRRPENGESIEIIGNNYESNKYGDIWVQWETNLNNWEKWQDIDNAIWRLLDTWNSAPSSQKNN